VMIKSRAPAGGEIIRTMALWNRRDVTNEPPVQPACLD